MPGVPALRCWPRSTRRRMRYRVNCLSRRAAALQSGLPSIVAFAAERPRDGEGDMDIHVERLAHRAAAALICRRRRCTGLSPSVVRGARALDSRVAISFSISS